MLVFLDVLVDAAVVSLVATVIFKTFRNISFGTSFAYMHRDLFNAPMQVHAANLVTHLSILIGSILIANFVRRKLKDIFRMDQITRSLAEIVVCASIA